MIKIYALISVLILLMFSQFTIAAEPIGRLFTSSVERHNLDHLRQTRKLNVPITIEEPNDALESTPIVLPRAVNLQGYVKRNDGKRGTVWVNHHALQENSGNQDVQVGKLSENSNRVPIKLSVNGRRLSLQAGQVYDPATGRVREARNHAAQGQRETMDGAIDDSGF